MYMRFIFIGIVSIATLTIAMEQPPLSSAKVYVYLGKIVNRTNKKWQFSVMGEETPIGTALPYDNLVINHPLFNYKENRQTEYYFTLAIGSIAKFSLYSNTTTGPRAISVTSVLNKLEPTLSLLASSNQIFSTDADSPYKNITSINEDDEVSVVINITIKPENGDYTAHLDIHTEIKYTGNHNNDILQEKIMQEARR